MITIAIYTRKSKSTDKGESIENQKKICLEHIKKIYSGEEVKTLFYDEGEGKSGGDSQRIVFQKLMRDAKLKIYDILMCYRLDRVARSVGDFSDLIEELTPNKISFISVKEQFDTTTPMGRAMMYTASVFAQLEREIGAERVKDNLHELAKTGIWLGGTTPTGYKSEEYTTTKTGKNGESKKKKIHKLEKVEDEGKLLEILFDKLEEFHTLTAVESHLFKNDIFTRNKKMFTRITLYNIYTNIVYAKNDIDMYNYLTNKGVTIYANKEDFDGTKGMIGYNKTIQQKHKTNIKNDISDWIITIGEHEGYISGKRWIKIQEILEKNKEKAYRRPRKNNALLSGILKCKCNDYMRPKVNSRMTKKYGEVRFSYMCRTKELSRKSKCDNKNIDGNELDKEFLKQMKTWFAPNSKIVKELKNISSYKEETDDEIEIIRLKKMYEKNKKEMTNLIERLKYIDIELIDDINKEVKKLREENVKINEKIKKLKNTDKNYQMDMTESEIAKIVLDVIENYFDSFTQLNIMKQRNILKMFISSAVWDGEKVVIDLLNTNEDEFFLDTMFPQQKDRFVYTSRNICR